MAEVTLTAPSRCPRERAVAFASEHSAWIESRREKQREILERIAEEYKAHDKKSPFLGGWIAIEGASEPFYRARAKEFFTAECAALAKRLNRTVKTVTIRDQTSRYGSCSSKGALSFSFRIMKAPLFAARYLAAHECSHLVHPNHSAAFWRCVENVCADYRSADRWIKQNSAFLRFDPQ